MSKILLLGIIIVFLGQFIIGNREAWTQSYDVDYWQDVFLDSQLVRGDKARNLMSDYDIYAVVGYKYWHGDHPFNLHTEVPPFGKQLIGLGIVLFDNANMTSLILGLSSLVLVYFLGLEILKSQAWSLTAVLLTATNSEFLHLLTSSNLDIPLLFLLLVSVLGFMKGLTKPYWFWLSSFSLGLFMATKFFLNGLWVMGVYFLFLLLYRDFKVFIRYVTSLVFVVVGYVIPYIPGLIHYPDLLYFLRFQRWLASWWAGNTAKQVGDIYNIIFTGSWKAWWTAMPTYIRVEEWNITWPILCTLGTASIFRIIKTRNFKIFLLWLWPTFYLLFLTFTAPFPRYTVMLFPFWALLTVYLFKK